MTRSKTGLNHSEARTEEQRALMAKIEADGVCPFCKEYFTTYHPKPIIKETNYWFVTENMSPYEGSSLHIIFVYKPAHISKPQDISGDAAQNLFSLISEIADECGIEGGSFFMRFGDPRWNSGSVEHLHAHMIVGTSKSEDGEKIKVALGWKV